MPSPSKVVRFVRIAIAASSVTLLAGCVDYLNHRDTITLRAGDARNANLAIQTVDPQANRADDTNIRTDGKYVKNVIDQYHTRPSPDAEVKAQSLTGQ